MPEIEGVPGDTGQGANVSPPVSPPAAPPPQPAANAAPPVSPPASPPSPPAAPPVSEEPKPFYASFKNAELRGWAEVKGIKDTDPEAAFERLANSYRNFERLKGVPEDRLVELPKERTPETMKPVLEKLGLAPPAEAKEYGFTTVDGVDKGRAGALEAIALKRGVPKEMAAGVFQDIIALEAEQLQAIEAREAEESAIDRGKFMARHGLHAEGKIEHARRFVKAMGMDQETLERMETQMGAANFWEFFSKAGETMGEAGFVGNDKRTNFEMTPEAATQKRAQLMSDKDWLNRYTSGDKAAAEQMSRLNQIIASIQVPGVAT